jgi:predicted ribosomally synthesized peptide with nif11-like leader
LQISPELYQGFNLIAMFQEMQGCVEGSHRDQNSGATLAIEPWRVYMSKENALSFLEKAANDPNLKSQVKQADKTEELVKLAASEGYPFAPDDVRQVIPTLKAQTGFFGDLVEAILELFGPNHDDYPTTGVQPFSGDPPAKH